jgi:hypothetical protein
MNPMDSAEYCREIETYLCRKNEGHLIRIVGPAFEQVCGWATLGVPLKIAFRGIDQYCERYYAKGPRRRPVRIEFCEADILDLFDSWRRAVGVGGGGGGGVTPAVEPPARKAPLAAHIERAVARLTTLRGGGKRSAEFSGRVDAVVRELDHLAADARAARGDRRAVIIDRLQTLDGELIEAALKETQTDASIVATLNREAEAELAPFISRMPEQALDRARVAAFQRLLRDALGLPVLQYE